MFVALEGIEACGKGTLANSLVNHFKDKGLNPLLTSDLYHTGAGIAMRKAMLSEEYDAVSVSQLFMMTAARIQNIEERIKPALAENRMVISDRFNLSTWAYQYPWSKMSKSDFAGICDDYLDLKPELTLFLDIPPELSKARSSNRGSLDKFEKRGIEFFNTVRNQYLELVDENRVVLIDASKSIDEVFESAVHAIQSYKDLLQAK